MKNLDDIFGTSIKDDSFDLTEVRPTLYSHVVPVEFEESSSDMIPYDVSHFKPDSISDAEYWMNIGMS